MTTKHRVFTYGTFKSGHCRSPMLLGEHFVGIARTFPEFRLYDTGHGYPAMIEEHEAGIAVDGEIWEVSDAGLYMMDRVEGVDSGLYRRIEIRLHGEKEPAFTYVYGRPEAARAWKWEDIGSEWTLEREKRGWIG